MQLEANRFMGLMKMVDDWMMVGSDERTRRLDTPSGSGMVVGLIESGMIEECGPAARRFVGACGRGDVVDAFEGILEGRHV